MKTHTNETGNDLDKDLTTPAKLHSIQGECFETIDKATSPAHGWTTTTGALQLSNGCLVRTTTLQRDDNGTLAISEALCFVPQVKVVDGKLV